MESKPEVASLWQEGIKQGKREAAEVASEKERLFDALQDHLDAQNKVLVLYSGCGHAVIQLRPAGVADPMNCLCHSCHPACIATREWECSPCYTDKIREEQLRKIREFDAGPWEFDGKPLDSECSYGYHTQCLGCNCSCHKAPRE